MLILFLGLQLVVVVITQTQIQTNFKKSKLKTKQYASIINKKKCGKQFLRALKEWDIFQIHQ